MEEKNNLAKPEKTLPETMSQILRLMLEAGAISVNTRCSICNSKYADEVNEMLEAKKTPTDVKKFLESKGEKPPSLSNICYHVNEHFKKQSHLATLMDFCDKVTNIAQYRRHRSDNLLTMLDMSYVDLAEAYSIPVGDDMGKRKDKNDIIMKIRKDIRETMALLNDMEDVHTQVRAVEIKFIKTFKTKIENAKSDTEKQMYMTAMQDFKDHLDAMK